MSAPQHRDVVRQVDEQHPHLLRHNTFESCGEFCQRVLLQLPHDEEWGHVGKSAGEKGVTFPNGVRVSHDVIFSRRFHQQVDIINGAAGHPNPAGVTWSEIDPAEYRPGNHWTPQQPLFDSGAPGGDERRVATLARSWFCFMRGLQDWHGDVLQNYQWLLSTEGTEVFRVMLCVEGRDHITGGRPDVWRDAGVFIDAPWWDDRFREMLDLFGQTGRRGWLTIYGGRNQTPTGDSRRELNDRIVRLISENDRWPAVFGFEVANEYKVNRWTDAEVRDIGRDLRSKVPAGTLIALSSPEAAHGDPNATSEDMQAAMDMLYGGDGGGANCMTVHVNRDPRSRWASPFSYNNLMTHLPKINNEPRGQGASAGGDVSDPRLLVGDYAETSQAGWLMHVAHNAWGVWNGRIPSEWGLDHHHAVRDVWDQENQGPVSIGLREYRQSGVVIDFPDQPEPPDPEQPPDENGPRSALQPGDGLEPGQKLTSPDGRCTCDYQGDGNLVVYRDGHPIWATLTDGRAPGSVEMQHDGNLVMYDADSQPAWASNTSGHNGAMVQLQDDGNLVIYLDGQPIWSSL